LPLAEALQAGSAGEPRVLLDIVALVIEEVLT
jgi:hypothetical protein